MPWLLTWLILQLSLDPKQCCAAADWIYSIGFETEHLRLRCKGEVAGRHAQRKRPNGMSPLPGVHGHGNVIGTHTCSGLGVKYV